MNKTVIWILIVTLVLLGVGAFLIGTSKIPSDLSDASPSGEKFWEALEARLASIFKDQPGLSPRIIEVRPNPVDQNICEDGLCNFIVTVANNYFEYSEDRKDRFSYLVVNVEEMENKWLPGWSDDIIFGEVEFLNDNQIQFQLSKDLILNKFKIRLVNHVNGNELLSDEYIVEASRIPQSPEIRKVEIDQNTGNLTVIGTDFNSEQYEDSDSPVMALFIGVSQRRKEILEDGLNIIEVPFDYIDNETITIRRSDVLRIDSRDVFLMGVNSLEEGQYAIGNMHDFIYDVESGNGDSDLVPQVNNQVFFRNDNLFSLSNDYAYAPISFELDEAVIREHLGSYKLFPIDGGSSGAGIPTQITPTSYYKESDTHGNLYVRTAIVKVLISLNPGQTKNYNLLVNENNSSESFTEETNVYGALRNGAIKVEVKDLLGGTYKTVFDIDDPSLGVELIDSGPVARVYKLVKNHDPVSGCDGLTDDSSGCLPYLFSSTFYVTAVSGKPHIKIDHFVSNFGNLEEDTWTQGNPYNYSKGQNGFVFYDYIKLETSTSVNSDLRIMDSDYLKPSVKQNISDSKDIWWIMPTNGQQILSAPPYNEGPNTNNYIAAGQGFLSRGTLTLGSSSALPYDYFENEKIFSGQSLEKWNKIGSSFEDLSDPEAINPNFDWTEYAGENWSEWKSNANDPKYGHRFGNFKYSTRGLLFGWAEMMRQEPSEAIRYLLSCQNESGCRREYLDSLRLFQYGTSSFPEHGIGFIPSDHPKSFPLGSIGITPYEGSQNNQIICRDYLNGGPKDMLGFCDDKNAGDIYMKDSSGKSISYFMSNLGADFRHGWTGGDFDHMSAGYELSRYMLTGDYIALDIGRHRVDNAAASFAFDLSSQNGFQQSDRAQGRALIGVAKLFSLTGDSYYQDAVGRLLKHIDYFRNKDSHFGISPVTGDLIPVKYLKPKVFPCNSNPTGPAPYHCFVNLFAEMQIPHGISVAYFDAIVNQNDKNLLKNILNDYYEFLSAFAYKDPTEVRNAVPSDNGLTTLWELEGGRAHYNLLIAGPSSGNLIDMFKYSSFENINDHQIYQGWCNSLKVLEDINENSNYGDYLTKFKKVFDTSYIKQTETLYHWGIQLDKITDSEICGLHFAFEIPNASEESNQCRDDDGDGYTTCAYDSDDNNPNIHPGNSEGYYPNGSWNGANACSDGIDNNSNGLVDCNDRSCAWQGNEGKDGDGLPWDFCRAPALPQGFCGDGIVQTPNSYGLIEECDVRIEDAPYSGVNNCASKVCLPPSVSGIAGCTCGL